MSYRSGNAVHPSVIQRYDAHIAQRQVKCADILLTGHFSRNAAVRFVGKVVLAGNGFHLEHVFHVFAQVFFIVHGIGVRAFDGYVLHHRFRRRAEHVRHLEVYRRFACLFADKTELHVARSLTNDIHRTAFAVGYTA